ncbi:uncharacterized protein DDB_G0283357-like [Cajanus cajan]|uniref:uncharacterized protein DDB_G0283357-like n=1 Tax=Cajanus cajan TaxID=3821 RepID=UPI00098D95B5|nr:uncharacterized protein DDB_G0283357-like [Cajanus cajan]
MNVPNLTRENVASHLQKYRIFLRKVADKGLIEGLSNRDLKSRFASGLSPSVIRDFQAATAKARVPVQQYMKRLAHQSAYGGIANALKPYNHVSRSTSYVTTTFGRSNQFPYSLHKGLNMRVQHQHGDSLNQARLGMQSSFATNNAGANYNNIQQKMLGSYANSSYYSKSSCNNVGAVFQSNGTMGHGLITANGLRGGVKYGNQQLMNQNYGTSLENYHKFSYDQVNWNMGSLNYSNNNNLTWNSTTYNTNGNIQQNGGSQVVGNGMKGEYNNAVGTTDSIANNSNNNLTWNSTTYDTSSSIQQNGGSQVVGNGTKGGYNNTIGTLNSIANNNSFGLIKGTTQNTNRNVVAPLGQGNSGLAQGGFASASASIAMDYVKSSDHLPPAFITNNGTGAENVSVNQQRSQQQNVNVAGNVTSIGEGDFNHLADEVDLSDLFLMIDEMDILIETGENPNASELPKSDFSNSTHAVQSHEQSNSGSDMIIDQTESTLNVSNESPTSSDKNSNQLGGYSGFLDIESLDRFMVDDVSSARDSATYQDWDMDFIETLFAAETN